MRNAGLKEAQAGIQITGRNINNLRYADDTNLIGGKWTGTKKLPGESEKGGWKSWLKAQHSENEDHGMWSHHFMGNRWGNNRKIVRLYFFAALKPLQMVIAVLACGPIASWKIDGEIIERLSDFTFLQLRNHCRLWLQRWNENTLLGRKVMPKLDTILKISGITLSTKSV